MRHRLSVAAAVVVAVAVALLFGACEPIESGSSTVEVESSQDGGTGTSVTKVYIVQEGDTLSSIAQEECGSGAAVEALAEVNVGRQQPDGKIMKDPDLLRPGWKLVVSCSTVSD